MTSHLLHICWGLARFTVFGCAVYLLITLPSVPAPMPSATVPPVPTAHWQDAQRAGNLLILDALEFDATLRPQPPSGSLWVDAWQSWAKLLRLDPCAARPPVISLLDIPGIAEVSIPYWKDPVYRIRKTSAYVWETLTPQIIDTLRQVGRYRCPVL